MPLTITIPTAQTVSNNSSKPYTVYTLQIRSALRTTTLQKRYSDFAALHAALVAATGAVPPAPLPAKSWFFARTVNNPALTEERRKGLEAYCRAIEEAEDKRWRESRVWREFLGLSHADGGRNGSISGGAAGGSEAMTPAAWLDAHRELKTQLHEARLCLTRREGAATATAQHEAGAAAKRCLVRAGTLIGALEDGLRAFSGGRSGGGDDDDDGGWSRERLGEGEIRRRRDMVSAARKEKEGLEGVLNALAIRSAVAGQGGRGSGVGMASQLEKEGLFKGVAGAASGSGITSGRRVLGGPPKETERTRELDNEGVLQMQRQMMREQDEDVGLLLQSVRRMKEMGVQINEELVLQSEMLDVLDTDVDRVQGKIDVARKRIGKIR